MAKRPASVGKDANGATDSEVIDRRDAQGNEPDDVVLEDRILSPADRVGAKEDDADAKDEADAQKKGAPPTFVDPRDELVKGFHDRRAAAKDGKPAPVGDDLVDDANDLDDGDAGDDGDAEDGEVLIVGRDGKPRTAPADQVETKAAPAAKKAAPAAADEIPDDRAVTMVVDGVKVAMTYGEMRRVAQQNLASESRLRQANELLDRARTVSTDTASTRTDPSRRDQGEAALKETRQERIIVDQAKVKAAIPKIQLGDDDEAAKALADVIADSVSDALAQRDQTKVVQRDVSSEVDDALAERDAKAEVNQALRTVAENYSDIIGDDDYAPAAYTRAHKAAVEQLRAIGVPEQDLRLPAQEVFLGHARLRQDPRYRERLEPLTDVFVSSAEETRKKFNLPERQVERDAPRIPTRASQQQTRVVRTDEDRSGRKGKVTVQPRSGSVRTDYTGNGVAPKKTPPSDVVARMAEQRGQFVGTRQ